MVLDTLVYCWALAVEQGRWPARRSTSTHRPVVLDCRDRGGRTTVAADALVLTRATCGSGAIELVSGTSSVTSLELVKES
ncbi:MAG: hypothetical protein R2734_08635 [Nocardioides sp.]